MNDKIEATIRQILGLGELMHIEELKQKINEKHPDAGKDINAVIQKMMTSFELLTAGKDTWEDYVWLAGVGEDADDT